MSEFKALFTSSKDIDAKFGIIKIGKYIIEPLPTNSGNQAGSTINYLLRFEDDFREGEMSSNPIAEAQIFLSFLSLQLGSRIDIDSTMYNNVKTTMPDSVDTDIYKEFRNMVTLLPDLDVRLNKIMSLDDSIAIQFLRACEIYRIAVNLIGNNNTLSFFLLSTSIECLSNKVSLKRGVCEKFVDFIATYYPDKINFKDEVEYISVLKEIYYNHRSGFTHGGKAVPEASHLADKLNKAYIKNSVEGKEVRTPGLKWFELVVRSCLIDFLDKTKQKDVGLQNDHFKAISVNRGVVHLIAKRSLVPGQVVTTGDVDLD
jgi:hypothetical protein